MSSGAGRNPAGLRLGSHLRPRAATREFTFLVSDYAATVAADHLATVIEEQAPGVRLRLQQQIGVGAE
ncbi:hypothetical protein K7711_32835 [Nocardia sp. CA2R105]|uniref:hypothetical protein n=1 Tax=Nocardia coffeae TaxID=2873381 RepID=UPI001CA66BD0|nr:hypothetical protein [Nocardia coffeae]MBY8861301.1 hypothetical protein [Nocardia coffeae]